MLEEDLRLYTKNLLKPTLFLYVRSHSHLFVEIFKSDVIQIVPIKDL